MLFPVKSIMMSMQARVMALAITPKKRLKASLLRAMTTKSIIMRCRTISSRTNRPG